MNTTSASGGAGHVGCRVRPLTMADAGALHRVQVRNVHRLRRTLPAEPAGDGTLAGTRDAVSGDLQLQAAGLRVPLVVVVGAEVVGRVTLYDVRGEPWHDAAVEFWVSDGCTGGGVATAALGQAVALARSVYGLNRLHAARPVRALAAGQVLAKNGFELIGVAWRWARLAGTWEDHLLYQRLLDGAARGSPDVPTAS